ncbi:hypothetical protein NBH00_03935 [Paraconexibacter antarcticus]|uniref:Universal stress protein n=1 Tax=Paraconexibacter antarcticus TaxID=2949664 RepID=A0ABY5DXG5_9ACTN|nr:hypothetical protein [Paraconexibacter antarcticus]UTI65367.1 hypothetical protein NBH00_03935 [Paraconexibacter antarcticus]
MPESNQPTRVLVVAEHPAPTPLLREAMRERAQRGPVRFLLLVPNPAAVEWHLDPSRRDRVRTAREELDGLLRPLVAEVGAPIEGTVSVRHYVMDAVEEVRRTYPFDEIIVETRPHPIGDRLHLDVVHQLRHLGVPVTPVFVETRAAQPA